jgi:hypothetical protein
MARQTNYGCRNGTSRAALLRSILEDYGHVVEVNSHTARQMLTNSIRRGIELGRLRTGVSTVQLTALFCNSTSSEKLLTGYRHLAVPSIVDPHLRTDPDLLFLRQWLTSVFCLLSTTGTFLKVHLLKFHKVIKSTFFSLFCLLMEGSGSRHNGSGSGRSKTY